MNRCICTKKRSNLGLSLKCNHRKETEKHGFSAEDDHSRKEDPTEIHEPEVMYILI